MKGLISNNRLKHLAQSWSNIAPFVYEPQTDNDYDNLSSLLGELLDVVGSDESHHLIGLVDVVSHMIAKYDEQHYGELTQLSGVDALKYLMAEHKLKQSELPEVGSQGVVSEVLNGKRSLNVTQIKSLAQRFKVTANTFID